MNVWLDKRDVTYKKELQMYLNEFTYKRWMRNRYDNGLKMPFGNKIWYTNAVQYMSQFHIASTQVIWYSEWKEFLFEGFKIIGSIFDC